MIVLPAVLFTKNNTFALREVEVRERFGIRTQACAVSFIRGEAIKSDQTPGDIVCTFMRHEVADQVPVALDAQALALNSSRWNGSI